ncbi:MAG: type II toxin-antitoxin system Phd/YefM family antitoxin [Planctomycetota bacterium]|jgi:hypothetical protein
MTIISEEYARRNLHKLFDYLYLTNGEIVIERAGKKLAKLIGMYSDTQTAAKGKLDFRDAAGLGSEVWKNIDVDRYVDDERDSWD